MTLRIFTVAITDKLITVTCYTIAQPDPSEGRVGADITEEHIGEIDNHGVTAVIDARRMINDRQPGTRRVDTRPAKQGGQPGGLVEIWL